MPDVKQRLAAIGFVPIGDTPAEFAAYPEGREARSGRKVISEAGIKLSIP